jgi:hypothetical protein
MSPSNTPSCSTPLMMPRKPFTGFINVWEWRCSGNPCKTFKSSMYLLQRMPRSRSSWTKRLLCAFVLLALLMLSACLTPATTGATLSLKVHPPATCDGTFSYAVELTNAKHEGMGDQWIKVSINGEDFERLKTDQNGRFSSTGDMHPAWCNKDAVLTATFEGTKQFGSATVQQILRVAACNDGTAMESCSQNKGYYCDNATALVFNCDKCGCTDSLICSDNACVTADARVSQLISELQGHIVKVKNSYVEGSGIVFSQETVGATVHTAILTNHHVVEDAWSLEDIQVLSNSPEGKVLAAYVAPLGIDLAIVEVEGKIGTPIDLKYVDVQKGQAVVALGSPLGFQGSVSKGIISNFVKDDSNNNYTLDHIQTDAAINPGSSGGGLFLESDGSLVGINTYKYTNTEGLGFAIDFRELNLLPAYKNWIPWAPPKLCDDGTPYGLCSLLIPYACDDGKVVPACEYCGCPPADGTVCYTDGKCRVP